MCRRQSRWVLFLVGALAVACDRGAPADKRASSAVAVAVSVSDAAPPPPADAPVAADIATGDVCLDAIAAWTTLPQIPEAEREQSMYRVELRPSVERARQVLSSSEAFEHCSDAQLAPLLALSMTRFEDHSAMRDDRGGDGVRFDVRYVATAILSNLSGQAFGTLSVRYHNESMCEDRAGHDASVTAKWQAWWQQVQKDPVAVVAAARTGKAPPFVFDRALAGRLEKEDKEREAEARRCATARAKALNDARKRPRNVSKECWDNPLAKGCN